MRLCETVELATSIGVGGTLEGITLGGKTDDLHGPSIELASAKVVRLTDGDYTLTGAMMTGTKLSCGPTAALEIPSASGAGSTTVVVCSYHQQVLDPALLRDQGVEPTDCDYIVLKSAVHFRSNFTEMAGAIVEVTGPGIHSSR